MSSHKRVDIKSVRVASPSPELILWCDLSLCSCSPHDAIHDKAEMMLLDWVNPFFWRMPTFKCFVIVTKRAYLYIFKIHFFPSELNLFYSAESLVRLLALEFTISHKLPWFSLWFLSLCVIGMCLVVLPLFVVVITLTNSFFPPTCKTSMFFWFDESVMTHITERLKIQRISMGKFFSHI